jgi:hypothetical protein
MNPDSLDRALLGVAGEHPELIVARSPTHDYAMLEEFRFIRREAQAEADLAYEAWRRQHCNESYAVYRAAQDRADAAQDDLADWVRRIAAAA